MTYYSSNIFIKIWLVINVLLGIAGGSFFAYEKHKSCGGIFTAEMVACFLYSFISLVLLLFRKLWTKYLHIFNVAMFITFATLSFISVSQIKKDSLCDSQWCLGNGVNTEDFISSFKSSRDTETIVSKFCSRDVEVQQRQIQNYALYKFKIVLSNDDVWYIDNSAPFALTAFIGSLCILMCILLIADTIREYRHKNRTKRSLLV